MIAGLTRPRARTEAGALALRRATAHDASRVLAWNGAPEVRARSLDPRPISPADHARWFAARLADPTSRMWIALLDGSPVGVVRIDRAGPAGPAPGRISIVLDAAVRGRGLGRQVIALACAADGGPVVADILPDNHASRASFEAAGFVLVPPPPASAGAPSPAHRYLWRPRHVHV
jgi:UDP-2,4-diacetamido-2,4,6-trideoxy-beta-L-altropyranose hydrolase